LPVVFSFILMFINNWSPYCAMALFVYWLRHLHETIGLMAMAIGTPAGLHFLKLICPPPVT